MAASNELKKLVDQMPDPDERKMYTKNIDKEKIEKAIAVIQAGGSAYLRGLIEMLGTPGSGSDLKPRYALHCLVNHILQGGNENVRREFGEVVAWELGQSHPSEVKIYLCQELQWAGGEESVPALGKLLLNEDLTAAASMALVSIHQGAEAQFLQALAQSKGRSRLNILQGLTIVGSGKSAPSLQQALKDPDRDIRIMAGRGLSRMADPGSVEDLLASLDKAKGWERTQAAKHCLILAENLALSGHPDDSSKVYQHLIKNCQNPSEAHVREAAERGLKSFSQTPA